MKTVRKFTLLISMLAIAVVAAACGGGDDSGGGTGNPAAPVEGLMNAMIAGEGSAADYVCSELDEAATAEMEDASSGLEEMGDVEIDLSGLEYNVADETDDSANVTISGVMTLTVEGQEVEQPVDALFADLEIPVIKEGDDWVICDPAIISGGF